MAISNFRTLELSNVRTSSAYILAGATATGKMKCVRFKPCKGVRLMRVALSGLKIVIGHFAGIRPTLLPVAPSGLVLLPTKEK